VSLVLYLTQMRNGPAPAEAEAEAGQTTTGTQTCISPTPQVSPEADKQVIVIDGEEGERPQRGAGQEGPQVDRIRILDYQVVDYQFEYLVEFQGGQEHRRWMPVGKLERYDKDIKAFWDSKA